jgi:hypothetical protein
MILIMLANVKNAADNIFQEAKMAKTLREQLAATTKTALDETVRQQAEDRRTIRRQAAFKAAETKRFVRESLDREIERAKHAMEVSASQGEISTEVTWNVTDRYLGVEDAEEVRKHKLLREKVAQHFKLEGLDVEISEDRPQVRNNRIPISDGYSNACPPMEDAGYTHLVLALSWGETDS